MKSRVFDPKLGRFLTTDPIVSSPLSGQGWNAYSYVRNNPLNAVDPSGFQEASDKPPLILVSQKVGTDADGTPIVTLTYTREGTREPIEVGATTHPVDVGTTGSASGYVPQPVTTAPTDWIQTPQVQLLGGFLGGLMLGAVPFAGVGQQLLDAAEVLPHGTPEARLGLALGQIVSGFTTMAGGLGGMASATGVGASLGVPAIVVSAGLVVGGAGNIAAGIRGLSQALMSEGSGSAGPQGTAPAARGEKLSGKNPPISPRQALHTNGTPGKSQFKPGVNAESVTRTAWEQGTPVFDKNGNFLGKRFTFNEPIGTSPTGYDQSSVFVHWSPSQGIHGVPTTVGGP